MTFYFYVIYSETTDRFYKGHTQDLKFRIKTHNAGKTRSIKSGIPWLLAYSEKFETREEAVTAEKYYKTFQGGKELKIKIAEQAT
jgi:putative endonuclease